MNKNGFTLVELMAVIVIIALLMGIGTFSYIHFIEHGRERTFLSYQDTMHATAANYYMKNPLPNNNTEEYLYLNDLVNNGYIDIINNPSNNNDKCISTEHSLDSYILVKRKDREIKDKNGNTINTMISLTYTVKLNCQDFDANKRIKIYKD